MKTCSKLKEQRKNESDEKITQGISKEDVLMHSTDKTVSKRKPLFGKKFGSR
jgi:hypothetical protein